MTNTNLKELRDKINSVDLQLLELLSSRRSLSQKVAQLKIKSNLKIRDIKQEHALLNNLISKGKILSLDSHYISKIYNFIIEDSVLQQQSILQNKYSSQKVSAVKVAYLGKQGSYSSVAAHSYFNKKNLRTVDLNCDNFNAIFKNVETGCADYGIVPIENSTSGSINQVYDLFKNSHLNIIGEIYIDIPHTIITKQKICLSEIEEIYTHPQPYEQCSNFLSQLNVKFKFCNSSADAIIEVKNSKNPNIAAIGNTQCCDLYDLYPLLQNIANQKNNITRFLLLSRNKEPVTQHIPAKTSLILSINKECGSLAECLNIFKQLDINMTKIESRPIIGNPWEYLFYIDIEENCESYKFLEAIQKLRKITNFHQVLGCYPKSVYESANTFLIK